MRKLLILISLLLIAETPARADWSISFGGLSDGGFIGFSYGEGYYGSGWSVSYGYSSYPGYPVYGYPGYIVWSDPGIAYWPSDPCYPSYGYRFGYRGYTSTFYSYSPTYSYSPRYDSFYPSYGGGYASSRPRYPVEGRYDSHDYRGGSRGYPSAPPPARYSGERSSPPPAAYSERDRGQQVYWNSRTSMGGSPSMGERPYRAPPTERTASAARGGDRGGRYGR